MYNHSHADSMLYIFISLSTGALQQQAPSKKVFSRTQKPEKHLKSEWLDNECKYASYKNKHSSKTLPTPNICSKMKTMQTNEVKFFGSIN